MFDMVKKVFINKIKNSSLLDEISENAVLEKVHLYHINLYIYIYIYIYLYKRIMHTTIPYRRNHALFS